MTTPSTLNRLFVANWRGVLGRARSRPRSTRRRTGSCRTPAAPAPRLRVAVPDPRHDSGVPAGLQYNAPYFDSTDPEERNNRSSRPACRRCCRRAAAATHEVKGGFEHFVSTRVGGNSQTSTGYVFQTDYKLDASGRRSSTPTAS